MITEYRLVYLSPAYPLPDWAKSISPGIEGMLRDAYEAHAFGWYVFSPKYDDRTSGPYNTIDEAVRGVHFLD